VRTGSVVRIARRRPEPGFSSPAGAYAVHSTLAPSSRTRLRLKNPSLAQRPPSSLSTARTLRSRRLCPTPDLQLLGLRLLGKENNSALCTRPPRKTLPPPKDRGRCPSELAANYERRIRRVRISQRRRATLRDLTSHGADPFNACRPAKEDHEPRRASTSSAAIHRGHGGPGRQESLLAAGVGFPSPGPLRILCPAPQLVGHRRQP